MTVAELTRSKTTAAGQYLGYGVQPVRLCYHLLSAPSEDAVSLEYVDDIAIHKPNGDVVLEQTKSVHSRNPAADRSKELWKTLANWADLCAAGTIDVSQAYFRYYVTPANTGTLVESLHSAGRSDCALALLTKFKTRKFQGKPGTGIEPDVSRFLAAGDEICQQIILRFELMGEADPLEAIRSKLRAAVPEETLDKFCEVAIGQAKTEIEKLIREKQQPVIPAGLFRIRFQAFIGKYNFSNVLNSSAAEPSSDDIHAMKVGRPTFVRQLEAVAASEHLLTTAISDFLRTTADKINWAADGEIVEESLAELDSDLLRHYKLVADEISDTHADKDIEFRGRSLYRGCIKLVMPLEGRVLPIYFISGEFNCLSDECRLGWHPNYKTMFYGASQ